MKNVRTDCRKEPMKNSYSMEELHIEFWAKFDRVIFL